MIKCSIGIMAYNEEANIRSLLDSILVQNLYFCAICDIVVVSSGSTDKTNEIVENLSRKDTRVRLIIQPERLGKASAINLFLKKINKEICILVNSDSILDTNAIEFLVKPFDDFDVGMTGGRPMPLYHSNFFMNHTTDLIWKLHHAISLCAPKMSELIAFRKDVIREIIEDTAVDEVCMEWQIKNSGYKTIYVPESKLYIRTPDTIKDFILQRRRIATGHIWAKQILKYAPATRSIRLSLQATFEQLSQNPSAIFFILTVVVLEYFSRILGWYDYCIRRRNPYIWKICSSTKSKLVHF